MKYFPVAALALAVASGIACAYLLLQLKAEREKAEAYLLRLHELEAAPPAARSPAASSGAFAASDLPPGGSTRAAAAATSGDVQPAIKDNPAMEFLKYEGRRHRVLQEYGALVRQLNLSGEQAEEFLRIMIEVREKNEIARRSIVDETALANALAAVETEAASRIISRFGDPAFAAYRDYRQALPERLRINTLNTGVSLMDAPLDQKQKDRLLAVLLEEKALTPPPGDASHPSYADWRAAYEDRVRGRVAAILNPVQLRQFDALRARD
jgi:type II secretory pathway component PulK